MEDRANPLLVICGPTASGKTALSINICKQIGGEVVSADSMQIYKDLNIGTAKPSFEEQQAIPHHLIDFLDPQQKFSAADYVSYANKAINNIFNRGNIPVVCGGTGQYISGLTDGLQYIENKPSLELREKLAIREKQEGIASLYQELCKIDPEFASTVHQNNKKRVMRGLELYYQTGITITQQNVASHPVEKPYNHLIVALGFDDRECLYDRINRRIDIMLANGLLHEAKKVYDNKEQFATAVQAIGYKELFPYFNKEDSLEACTIKLKQASRNYAKRQLTWFKRIDGVVWLDANSEDLTSKTMELWEKHNGKK